MRTIWKGALNFALLSVGIKAYKATKEATVKLKILHKECHTPIKMKRWCEKDEKELEWGELEKGYPVDENNFIIFTDEELSSLNEGGSKSIRVNECIDINKINPIAFNGFYYVVPEKGFERVYMLLRESLRSVNSCLVGYWVYRGKEYLVALKPYEEFLLMFTLRYSEEISKIEELPVINTKETPTKEEIELAIELVKKFSKKEWKLPDSSEYIRRFNQLLNKKSSGGIIKAPEAKAAEVKKPSDLMNELRKSLAMSETEVPTEVTDKEIKEIKAKMDEVPVQKEETKEEIKIVQKEETKEEIKIVEKEEKETTGKKMKIKRSA